MDVSLITSEVEFILNNSPKPAVRFKDTSHYAPNGIPITQVLGNIQAKRGASIFHNFGAFDNTADIVRGSTDNVLFDLPLDELQKYVLNGAYDFIYKILITNEVLYKPLVATGFLPVTTPSSFPFTLIVAPSVLPNFEQDILDIIANYSNKVVAFYDAGGVRLAESPLTGVDISGSPTLIFDSITYSGFANITQVKIEGTNYYQKTFSFDFCHPSVIGKIDTQADCLRAQINSRDITVYPAYPGELSEQIARTFRCQFPRKANGSEVADMITTSEGIITLGPPIWINGSYKFSIETVLKWIKDDGLKVTMSVIASDDKPITCDVSLCSMSGCIESLQESYFQAMANGDQRASNLRELNLQIVFLKTRFDIALTCRDTVKATEILTRMKTLLGIAGCKCGDTGSNNSEPYLLNPFLSDSITPDLLTYD